MKIAIASGKGGTGKTFVATNLFNALINRKHCATLVDCDAEAPNALAFFDAEKVRSEEVTQQVPVIQKELCTFCGKCREFCTYNAIFCVPDLEIIQVLDELCHSCGACTYACAFGAVSEKPVPQGTVSGFKINEIATITEARTNIGVMSPIPVIKAALKTIESEPGIVILDAPPGTSCPFIQTVARADYVVLVTEPTPFGLSDLKQSIETIRLTDKPFGVIINRAGLGNRGVHDFIVQENIPLLLEIPYDRQIAAYYSNGDLAGIFMPGLDNKLYEVFKTISAQ
jgi:MinD superfamily P-loop ATPase